MLHYYGDKLALELGEAAKQYSCYWPIPSMKDGNPTIRFYKVPFYDLQLQKIRYVKFEWLAGQWVFADVVD